MTLLLKGLEDVLKEGNIQKRKDSMFEIDLDLHTDNFCLALSHSWMGPSLHIVDLGQ